MDSRFLAITLVLVSGASAQNDIGCFRTGACTDSFIFASGRVATAEECLRYCDATTNCAEWTYTETTKNCALTTSCISFDDTVSGSLSGDQGCTDLQCFSDGRCVGTNVASYTGVANWQACNALCLEEEDCNWFTYNTDSVNGLTCDIYASCLSVQSCSTCISSQKYCDYPDETPCGATINLEDYTSLGVNLLSPNFPADYDNNEYCAWYIQAEEGQLVKTEFIEWDVEGSSCYDVVVLRDGCRSSDEQIVRQCGVGVDDPLPGPFYTNNSNCMYVLFDSDSSVNDGRIWLRSSAVEDVDDFWADEDEE